MRTEQGKAGFLGVIELRRVPGALRVALPALDAAGGAVHVIGRVAADTLHRRVFPVIAGMAGRTGNLGVVALQGKAGLGVVVADLRPALRSVAGGAIGAELALMGINALVAVDAATRRLAEGLAGLVATGAGDLPMPAFQLEIGARVIKLLRHQVDDLAVTAQVLGVAGAALGVGGVVTTAMQATPVADVGGDRLVAVETQVQLVRAIGPVMALAALGLDLGVRSGDLARHEQGFQARRPRLAPGGQATDRNQQ